MFYTYLSYTCIPFGIFQPVRIQEKFGQCLFCIQNGSKNSATVWKMLQIIVIQGWYLYKKQHACATQLLILNVFAVF